VNQVSDARQYEICHDSTVVAIQRLLAVPLLAGMPRVHRFSDQRDVIDGNALLDIQDDAAFVEAAYRQIHGREAIDRRFRRWVTRLRVISRPLMLVCLRYSRHGRLQATRIPGLWYALLIEPPRHGPLRLPFAGGKLHDLRRWILSISHDRFGRLRKASYGDNDSHP